MKPQQLFPLLPLGALILCVYAWFVANNTSAHQQAVHERMTAWCKARPDCVEVDTNRRLSALSYAVTLKRGRKKANADELRADMERQGVFADQDYNAFKRLSAPAGTITLREGR